MKFEVGASNLHWLAREAVKKVRPDDVVHQAAKIYLDSQMLFASLLNRLGYNMDELEFE